MVIPVFNQLDVTQECITHLRRNTAGTVPLLIVDNGSNRETSNYLRTVADEYIRNEQNVGVIQSMNQAWTKISTPFVAFLHNDVMMLEGDWDQKVNRLLQILPRIGVAGFGGGNLVAANGGRSGFISNMEDAEVHGERLKADYVPSVVEDGFCLIVKKGLLEELGGIALDYQIHHFYDLDICLEAIYHGYNVATLNCKVRHLGGVTSVRPEFACFLESQSTTQMQIYLANQAVFTNKWGSRAPVMVDGEFYYTDAHGPIGRS